MGNCAHWIKRKTRDPDYYVYCVEMPIHQVIDLVDLKKSGHIVPKFTNFQYYDITITGIVSYGKRTKVNKSFHPTKYTIYEHLRLLKRRSPGERICFEFKQLEHIHTKDGKTLFDQQIKSLNPTRFPVYN